MNIRTLLLMVAEKTLKLQGNPFFKVTEEQYLTLYAKIYALVDVFYVCISVLKFGRILLLIDNRISIIETF